MYITLDNTLATEITESNYKYLNELEVYKTKMFGPLTNVNIFIGSNNSGKSRFMRGLIKTPIIKGFDERRYFNELVAYRNSLIDLSASINEDVFF